MIVPRRVCVWACALIVGRSPLSDWYDDADQRVYAAAWNGVSSRLLSCAVCPTVAQLLRDPSVRLPQIPLFLLSSVYCCLSLGSRIYES